MDSGQKHTYLAQTEPHTLRSDLKSNPESLYMRFNPLMSELISSYEKNVF